MAELRDNPPNNLPVNPTSFVGRQREIDEVKRALGRTHLLTLTGAGGCGKTRLAIQVVSDLLSEYPDGIWLVDLGPLAEPGFVLHDVAAAVGAPEDPSRPLGETLVSSLQNKSLLLVLDNCEHLVSACAELADLLLRSCPKLRLLATSREPLNVTGETAWRVPSLSLPPSGAVVPPDRLLGHEAVQLFVERAQAVLSDFALTPGNAQAVAQICLQLDGIPLAIELAAVCVKGLSVDAIAARLNDRFHLLRGGRRTAPARHQTLEALIEWSHALLSAEEQTLLRRLSVFAGGWTLEAAEVVCSDPHLPAAEIPACMLRLLDKSLVAFDETGQAPRYRLLETVRHYSHHQLLGCGEAESIRARHLRYFLQLSEQASTAIEGSEDIEWLNRLETEHDNLRAALACSNAHTDDDGLRLASALIGFWQVRGHFTEGRGWLDRLLARSREKSAFRARALIGLGHLSTLQGLYTQARAFLEEGLALYREWDDLTGIAWAINHLGRMASHQGDHDLAESSFTECLAAYERLGSTRGIADALAHVGHSVWHKGDYGRARTLLDRSLDLARQADSQPVLIFALWSLGLVAFSERRHGEALACYRDGLLAARRLGDRFGIAFLLEAFAALAAAQGKSYRGAVLFGAAQAFREITRFPLSPSHQSDYEQSTAAIRAALDQGSFATAWSTGREETTEQAIEYALSSAPPQSPSPKLRDAARTGRPDERLTAREHEIATLIALGLSNRQIAVRLYIAQRTADTHVQHILNKLGFHARTQIAAWAAEHRLRAASRE